MLTSFRLAAIVWLFTAIAFSQQPADNKKPVPTPGPCDKAMSQVEITNCWEDQAQKSEAQLTALYQKIQKAIQIIAAIGQSEPE